MTLVNVQNVALTETDCWPLEKFGTWSQMTNYDLSLAPRNEADFKSGPNTVKIRFELVQGLVRDYSDAPVRSRYPALATDDTGAFIYLLP